MKIKFLIAITLCIYAHAQILITSGNSLQKSPVPNKNGMGPRTIYEGVRIFNANNPVEPVGGVSEQSGLPQASLSDLKTIIGNRAIGNIVQKTVNNLRKANQEAQTLISYSQNTETTVSAETAQISTGSQASPQGQAIVSQNQSQPTVVTAPTSDSLPSSQSVSIQSTPATARTNQPSATRQANSHRAPSTFQQQNPKQTPSRPIADSNNNLSTHQTNQIAGHNNRIDGQFNNVSGNSNQVNNGNKNQIRGSSNSIQSGSGNFVKGHGNYVAGTGNRIN